MRIPPHRLYLVPILCAFILSSCGGKKDSDGAPARQTKPNQPATGEIPETSEDPSGTPPFAFTTFLEPVGTSGFPIHSAFQISEEVPAGEQVRVSFRFHSREFERVQILRESFSGECGTDEKVPDVFVYPEQNPGLATALSDSRDMAHPVQQNTDYVLEYRLTSTGCQGLVLGVTLWMGFENEAPALVQSCVMSRDREEDKVLFLKDEGDTWLAWTGGHGEAFISQDRFCGRAVEATGIEMRIDHSSGRVYSATYTDEIGMGLGIRISIDEIHRNGNLDCTASGVYLFRYKLSKCYERVLDIAEWNQ